MCRILIFFLFLLFTSCSKKDCFVASNKTKPDEHGQIEWKNNGVFLRSEIDNSKWLQEYNIYLSLNKILDNDTISFYLLNTNNGKYQIIGNKLYIYGSDFNDLYSKNFYVGWSRVINGRIIRESNGALVDLDNNIEGN